MWVAICSSVKGSPAAVDDVSPAVVGGDRSIFDAEKHENPAKVKSPADTSCPNLGIAAEDGR